MKYRIDTHTHTVASGHAYNTINEMVHAAAEKGMEVLAITEHAPKMPGSCGLLYFYNLRVLRREKNGVKLLFGSEMNILDFEGTVDLDEHALAEIDLGIASIHPPCFTSGTIVQNTNAYIKAMDIPQVNIIGHPDDARFTVDYRELVLAAKEKHVLLEVNNNSLNPKGFRENTEKNDIKMLEYCMEYGVPIVLGSDAHTEEDIGEFSFAEKILEELSFPEKLIANASAALLREYLPFAKCF